MLYLQIKKKNHVLWSYYENIESLGSLFPIVLPVLVSTLVTTSSKANILNPSVITRSKSTSVMLPLTLVNLLEQGGYSTKKFTMWVRKTELKLNRSLYVTNHQETNEVELFCFDCDADIINSSLIELAGNADVN